MSIYVLPILFAVFAWWFGTGLVLSLDRLPRSVLRYGIVGLSALTVVAAWVLTASSLVDDVADAYVSFVAALVLWSWHEASFLFGIITGPRRTACPAGVTGWRRFRFATATVLYHELALAGTFAALVVATWDAPNQVGTATFGLLWLMRISAKLNVFFGVPYMTEEFLPAPLEHLKSYFGRRSMNLLFPVSVTATTALVAWLAMQAFADGTTAFETAGYLLLATLAALALLEHWLLVLPVRDAALWQFFASAGTEKRTGSTPVERRAVEVTR